MFELEKPSAYIQRKSRSPYDEGFEDGRDDGLAKGARIGSEAFAAYLRSWGFEVPDEVVDGATEFALKRIEDSKSL